MTDNRTSEEPSTKTAVAQAETDAAVFAAAASLPQVANELVPYTDADSEHKQRMDQLLTELDMSDSNSIIFFGAKAQQQLTTISDNMLDGVKNKDLGTAGESLNDMVATLRGFNVDELDPNAKPGFFARLFGRAKPIVKFLQKYEEVRKQIDGISNDLDGHKTTLLTDITSLDRLYGANLDYFHELEMYISAGEEKLRVLDSDTIPTLATTVENSDEVIKAQELRDLRSSRDDLERRVHDLRLTRQVTMQSLPSIRLVQENDKGLVNKINSTMANTIPLWRQQLATAVTIYRSGAAADTVRRASDLTNDLLEKNAENLKQANATTRREIERGVFDIESVKKANQMLIDTIQESLQIADEGKRMRSEAVGQLEQMEAELRKTLASASAHASSTGG